MLTLFAAMGFVEERQGVFHLTPLAREHLVKTSPWFLGPYYESLKNRPVALDLLKVLRTGKPANWGSQKDGKDWHVAMETEEFAAQFTAAMDSRGVYLAQAVAKAIDLSQRRHLLDIAGGSGVYACSLVTHHPHLCGDGLREITGRPDRRTRHREPRLLGNGGRRRRRHAGRRAAGAMRTCTSTRTSCTTGTSRWCGS